MNVNSLIASLLSTPAQAATTAGSAGAPAASDADQNAQFKAQFGQAVATLTGIVASANGSSGASGSGASTSASAAGGSSASAQSATDTLTVALQKKISDLLAAGQSVQQIVQQLAQVLANAFAAQFGGNPAQIQGQLQTAFTSALSPPGNGPPASLADLASSLAQRFRQVADLAAGVIGETGQSNRLFAGSFSDAATTAGGQPAPGSTTTGTTADSTVSTASALLDTLLTGSQGDGKTVALTAPAIGTNGDTLLGRILARAGQASPAVTSGNAAPAAPSTPPAATAADVVDRAIAAALQLLGQPTGTAPADPVAPSTGSSSSAIAAAIRADVSAASSTAAAAASDAAPEAPALNPAVTAFVKTFTDALAASGGNAAPSTLDKPADAGTATVLSTAVASSQAPTIGAFAPVAPVLHVDALAANPTPTPASLSQQSGAEANSVVEQVLRGAFLNTVGETSTVRLRLVPDALGDVNVKLAITGSSVSAQVVAQTPAAHDALVAGQSQLARSLSDAGLKLTSFDVSLGGGFASFQQQQQQQQSGQQPSSSGRKLLLGDVDTPGTDDASLAAIPSFAPPSTTAATGWGAYNYLV